MRSKIIIFGGLLCFDQLLKYLFSRFTSGYALIPGSVNFYLSKEDKIMGLIPQNSAALLFLLLLYFVIILFFLKNDDFRNQSGIALIFLLAGMTSNIIDRVFLGYVKDYIVFFNLLNFNLADVLILGGMGGVILNLKIKNQKSK